tara:strand:- start:105 stop:374 length:270 start_codon:yes stop_codon:yes gene_type:complete
VDEEIEELQARIGAVELLLVDLLALASNGSTVFSNRLNGLQKMNEMIREQMVQNGENITSSTHYRYLECIRNLLHDARSRELVFAPDDV